MLGLLSSMFYVTVSGWSDTLNLDRSKFMDGVEQD